MKKVIKEKRECADARNSNFKRCTRKGTWQLFKAGELSILLRLKNAQQTHNLRHSENMTHMSSRDCVLKNLRRFQSKPQSV